MENVTISFSHIDAEAEIQKKIVQEKNSDGVPFDSLEHTKYLEWLEHCLDNYDTGLNLYADSTYSTVMDTVDSYTAWKHKWSEDTIVLMPNPEDERHDLQYEMYWVSYKLLRENKATVLNHSTKLIEKPITYKDIKNVSGEYTEFRLPNGKIFWKVWTINY